MKKITKGMWIGALVWGIGVPFLMTCYSLMIDKRLFHFHQSVISRFIVNYIIFTFATGLFAILIGTGMGYFVSQWQQKNVNAVHIIIRSVGISSTLSVLVALALSTLVLISNNSLKDFGSSEVALLPLTLCIGAICGVVTTLLIYNY